MALAFCLVVLIRPCLKSSVVRLRSKAFLWSEGLDSKCLFARCLIANTTAPFLTFVPTLRSAPPQEKWLAPEFNPMLMLGALLAEALAAALQQLPPNTTLL
eukprot:CAMPEP_0182607726 /NCGR_PEP_ID=MMETSP1330-20130603/2345_1 /TAXON_ID=464278 /ORGANISM="Picochlorum sp., Strain RCC944" /LENGTH=100 /DNA_ID=CAMNT_0024826373 /DNA_START=272 /DNA_END=574 /DNA_ORIENTATION=+